MLRASRLPRTTRQRRAVAAALTAALTAALAAAGLTAAARVQAQQNPAPPAAWPSAAQAQAAIQALQRQRAPDTAPVFTVERVLGCLPAHQRKGVWVCPLLQPGHAEPIEASFQQRQGRWAALDDDARAACAPLRVAEAALRQLDSNPRLKVTGEVDDGQGLFTDQRGMLRKERGPYRLMCRYEVDTGWRDDALYITYVWHDGERYIIDADVEKW